MAGPGYFGVRFTSVFVMNNYTPMNKKGKRNKSFATLTLVFTLAIAVESPDRHALYLRDGRTCNVKRDPAVIIH
jgi:hypothetical protein